MEVIAAAAIRPPHRLADVLTADDWILP